MDIDAKCEEIAYNMNKDYEMQADPKAIIWICWLTKITNTI